MEKYLGNNKPKEETEEYIEFSDLQLSLKIKSKELFYTYIKSVYKDLAERDDENKKKGIPKVTFFDYIKLPVFIAESIFSCFDADKNGYLSIQEFGEGMSTLFLGSFEDAIKLIFNIYDSNRDGLIHKEDVRLLLSYLPLREDHSKTEYKYQLESQQEIQEIVDITFQSKEQLNYKEYLKITESKKSDSYIQLLCFLYEKKPFNEHNISLLENKKDKKKEDLNNNTIKDTKDDDKQSPDNSVTNSPVRNNTEYYSPQSKKRIPSPRKVSCLSPATNFMRKSKVQGQDGNLIKLCGIKSNDTDTGDLRNKQPETSAYEGMIRMPNVKINNTEKKDNQDFDTMIEKSEEGFDSPSNFLRRLVPKKKEFNILGSLVKISNDESTDKEHNYALLKQSKTKNFELPAMEGWIYKITENSKIKKYWLVVNNADIYYYKSENKEELSGMHNLSGCYVKESTSVVINGVKFYSFVIIFQSKSRSYYTTDREQAVSWVNRLRKAIGYESFFDYYEIIDDIGEGKFGVVKLGVHKNTKLRVAIKTIKKENLKSKQDHELVRSEIDIMKLCRHPNVVSLLDHFENSEYIFIVMEYIAGGDLTKYVQKYYGGKTNKTLPEKRVAELMKQLASGLEYLHNYGIIHRDLKPDNLMMTERTINGEIKVMDFGLSKMMHHDEKVADGFGTLSFVAPEVLIRKPYNKQVDVWSLGVIIYNLLSGELPFDDPSDNEEVIARKVVYSEVEFKSKIWEKITKEGKQIICDCLIKDPEKRITVSKFLNSIWFEKAASTK